MKVGGLAEAEAGRAWHPLSRPTLQEAAAATAGGGGTATAPLVPYLFADTSLVIAQSSFLIMRILAAEILHPLTPSPIPNPLHYSPAGGVSSSPRCILSSTLIASMWMSAMRRTMPCWLGRMGAPSA